MSPFKETSSGVLLHGTICFSLFYKIRVKRVNRGRRLIRVSMHLFPAGREEYYSLLNVITIKR